MGLSFIFLIVALVMFGISFFWKPAPGYDLIAGGLFFWVLSLVIAH